MNTPPPRRIRSTTSRAAPSITVHRRHGLEVTQVIDHNRQATLQVCGEMDAMSAPLLPTVVTRALPSGVGSVRLDLSRLSFCDAAGLRAVVEIHDQLGVRRVPLVLVGLRPKTRQLLAITGLDELLQLDEVLSVSRLGEVVHGPATVRQIS